MGNIISIFKAFYEHYDSSAIRRAYGTISQRTLFSELYKKVPFSVEIRMKRDVFAMQLNTDSIVSMELMTVIGFFFDKYSEARNCVWTKNPQKIKKFFNQGISEFIEFGGEVTLNLTDDSIQQIVSMLQKNNMSGDAHKRHVENFNLLENKNWFEYEVPIYSWIPICLSDKFFLLTIITDFHDEVYAVLRTKDITDAYSNESDSFNEEIYISEGLQDKVDQKIIKEMDSSNQVLFQLKKYNGFICIQCDEQVERCSFYMGKIITIEEDSIIFRDIGTDGKWEDEIHSIQYEEITQISFGDNYSKMYWKYVK